MMGSMTCVEALLGITEARLFVGSVNGLLPCGLVYVALAGAIATGGPLHNLCARSPIRIGAPAKPINW